MKLFVIIYYGIATIVFFVLGIVYDSEAIIASVTILVAGSVTFVIIHTSYEKIRGKK